MDELGALKPNLEAVARSVGELARTVDHHQAVMETALKAASEALSKAMQEGTKQLALSMNMATEAHRHATAGSRRYEHRLMWVSWALVAATVALLFVAVARIG